MTYLRERGVSKRQERRGKNRQNNDDDDDCDDGEVADEDEQITVQSKSNCNSPHCVFFCRSVVAAAVARPPRCRLRAEIDYELNVKRNVAGWLPASLTKSRLGSA